MLAALRVTFADIEATFRGGQKYWRLALPNRSGALELPKEIDELATRVERLTAEINDVRAAGAMNHAILDDALAESAVGIFILDADFRVVHLLRRSLQK